MTTPQRFPSDRLRLPGERVHNTVRVVFWLSLCALPFVVILCNYGGQP